MKSFNVVAVVMVALLVQIFGVSAESIREPRDNNKEDIERTIEELREVMKSLLNMAGSEKNKLSGLKRSLHSVDGALHSLEDDAYTLKQQNVETLNQSTSSDYSAEVEKLEEIKECVVEIQDTIEEIEGLVHPCGGLGWVEVVNVSYTDPIVPCPIAWERRTRISSDTNTERTGCGTKDISLVTSIEAHDFNVNGMEYDEVCGRVHGYAHQELSAFERMTDDITGNYVTGVSVTHGSGSNTRHIWTFASSSVELESFSSANDSFCPCQDGRDPPSFVGQNYFCESGRNDPSSDVLTFHGDDLQWDGKDCVIEVCCTRQSPPYFHSYLTTPTTDNITVGLLLNNDQDILLTHIELYIRQVDP